MEQLQKPVGFVVVVRSGKRWLVEACSLAQAISSVQELAGEKVTYWQRADDW